MLVRPKQSQGRYSIRARLGNEELRFLEEFRYLDKLRLQAVEMIRILKKQIRRQNVVDNMLVKKFSFAHIEAKIQLFKLYCYPIYGCVLWRHSFQNSIRKLTDSYSDTFNRLINVPRYTSSSLVFAMNTTDHINVVLGKFAYSSMSRVIASPTVLLLPLPVAMHICSHH